MRHVFKMRHVSKMDDVSKMIVVIVVALAAHGIGVRQAKAEPQTSAVSTPAPSDIKSKTRHARVHRHINRKSAGGAAPAEASADVVFLSDAWLKQEKLTDDRLKRFMNICKGC